MAEAKWATDERRLQSAYDDISLGRFKSAQSAVDRHLKKHPKSQPALVLRMVIYEKNGLEEEVILRAFEAVRSTGELTGRSAWWVGVTLRNIQRLDLSLELYKSLWEKQPDRAELGEQVFLHSVAAWDQEVMTSSSRKLFNSLKNPVWARVAAWAEWVTKAPQPTPSIPFAETAPSNALRIATVLLSTTGTSNSTADILWLRIQILISGGDLQGALKVIVSDAEDGSGSLARAWTRMEAVPVILGRLGAERVEEWKAEWEWVKGVLQSDKDSQRNYAFYRYLLLTVSHLTPQSSIASETRTMLDDLATQIGEKERSPHLALLEFDSKLPAAAQLSGEEWTQAVEQYWSRWGSKGSVVSELEGITGNSVERQKLLASLAKDKSEASHADLHQYRKIVNATLIILRQNSSDWLPADGDVAKLWKLYKDGRAYGRNLPPTDVQPADDIGLAAVHLLVIQWSVNKSVETPLLRALGCLEFILERSPGSAQAKFLLVRVARLLGVSRSIPKSLFGSGGLTESQLDTLLHVIVERGSSDVQLRSSHWDDWLDSVSKAEKMYRRTASDMPEYVKQALQHEAYSKIPGIRHFAHILSHSLPQAVLRIERIRSRLLLNETPSETEIQALERLVTYAKSTPLEDSRDWDLMSSIGGSLPSLRDLTILGSEIGDEWVKAWGSVLTGLVRFLEDEEYGLLDTVKSDALLPAENAFILLLSTILKRAKSAGQQEVEGDGVKTSPASALSSQLDDLIQAINADTKNSRFTRIHNIAFLPELAKILELLSRRLDELSKPQGKGKNQKKPDPEILALVTEVKSVRDELKTKMKEVVTILEELEKEDTEIDWAKVKGDLLEDDEELLERVNSEVVESRRDSIKSLSKLLNGKKF